MLGPRFRFSVNNQCGVNVGVVIKAKYWKFNSSGELVFSTEQEVYNETGIASSATAWTNDTAVNNEDTGTFWLGAELTVTVTPAASVTNSGSTNVTVQIQRSTDNTVWPDAGRGQRVAFFNIPSGTTPSIWNASIGA